MLASAWTNYEESQFSNWQKESLETFEGTSAYVRSERVNKWPNCITYMMMMTIIKDVPHEIRSINLTNAVTFRSVTVEVTLSGHDSWHLKRNFCPQAGVESVTHIQDFCT